MIKSAGVCTKTTRQLGYLPKTTAKGLIHTARDKDEEKRTDKNAEKNTKKSVDRKADKAADKDNGKNTDKTASESADKDTKKKNPHEDHRQRLRQQFAASGFEGFPEHMILELLLFYSIPRRDTNELAHRLIDRFGSLANVFDAPFDALLHVEGVGVNTAVLIKLIPKIFSEYQRSRTEAGAVVHNRLEAIEYLKPYLSEMTTEKYVILLLDNAGRVLKTICKNSDETDTINMNLKSIFLEILSVFPAAVVLAHSHPRALAAPSQGDLATTQTFAQLLEKFGAMLCDHIIFSPDETFCMSQAEYLLPSVTFIFSMQE